MNFEYNEDQRVFKDSVSKYLQDNYDFEFRRATVASEAPFSEQVWQQCAELGWLYLPFSEEQGGIGGTAVDTILLFEELGKQLVIEPFLETLVLGAGILRRLDPAAAAQYHQPIMEGSLQLAVAHFESTSRGDHRRVQTTARTTASGFVLNGNKAVVYNATAADVIIVSARLGDERGLGLFVVDKDRDGLELTGYPTVDGRVAADIHLNNLELDASCLVASGEQAMAVLEDVYQEALLALVAEMVGAMKVLLTVTVEYTKERKQFGQSLSKFQVLQHHMSDMFMATELARSLMFAAAIKLRDGETDAAAFVSAAKAGVDKYAKWVAHNAIQLHGGIATTDELNIGHYLKRITIANQLFGSTRFHLKRYANLMAAVR